jgi:L-fucose mutarotase
VLSLLPCDTFVDDPAQIMQVVGDPGAVPPVIHAFNAILRAHGWPAAVGVERHAFYEAAETAYALVQTGSGGSTAISC